MAVTMYIYIRVPKKGKAPCASFIKHYKVSEVVLF